MELLLVSHNHYDHMDLPTLRRVQRRWHPAAATGLGNARHLAKAGIRSAVELDWWEGTTLAGARVTYVPSQHFSARTLYDRNRSLWGGFVVEAGGATVYFAGDSGYCPHFAEIGQRLGPFDLVMIEVGAFHPSWGSVHLGPDNAITAWRQLGSGRFLPVHWGTFNLAMHPWDEPAEVLLSKVPEGLVMPRLGEAIEPARFDTVQPWWREAIAGHRRGQALEAASFLALRAKD